MKTKLDKNEKDMLASYDNDEWVEVRHPKNEMKRHMRYAKENLRKDKRINIRISRKDLESIQRMAIEEGIPYQTLVSSLIYKYVNGSLVDKKSRIARQ